MWRDGAIRFRSLLPIAVVAVGIYLATTYFGEPAAYDRFIQSVAFSRDGRVLVADVDHYLFVWETKSGELRCGVDYSPRYGVMALGSQMALAPSGARAGVDSYSLGAVVIDTTNCDRVATLGGRSPSAPPRLGGGPVGVSFGRDERYVVAADKGRPYTDEPPLHVYDADTGERLRSFDTDLAADLMAMDASATSPDGTRVAGGGGGRIGPDVYGGLVIVWDFESGEQLYHVTEPSPRVDEIGFSPDGDRLMVRGVDGGVRLWDAMRGGEPVVLRTDCESVEATAFLPQGDTLLVGCESGVIKACDTRAGNCEATALGKVRGVSALTAHPDGDRIAVAAGGGTITIVELATGRRTQKIDIPRSVPDTDQYGPSPPPTPPLEMFRIGLLGVGPALWLVGLTLLFMWLSANKAWSRPDASPLRRAAYTGLRTGAWLTIGGLVALVIVSIPAGPWMIFLLLFPVAYATAPVFMLTTALGLVIGVIKNRDRLSGSQLVTVCTAILVLGVLGTASLIVALRWIDEPK